jgi:hypothetical protein
MMRRHTVHECGAKRMCSVHRVRPTSSDLHRPPTQKPIQRFGCVSRLAVVLAWTIRQQLVARISVRGFVPHSGVREGPLFALEESSRSCVEVDFLTDRPHPPVWRSRAEDGASWYHVSTSADAPADSDVHIRCLASFEC